MPLNVKQLEMDIEKISNDAANGGSTDWDQICDAIARYALQGQYPPPAGVLPGLELMKPILRVITPELGPMAPKLLSTAFMLLGVSIMIGMPIGTGLGPTQMPTSGPNFDAVFSGPQDAKQFSKRLSQEIHKWMSKGKFDVGFIGPNGPVPIFVPWV